MPADTIPGITTGSFNNILPPDVQKRILNLLVGGAPFANSLSRQTTQRAAVAYPTAKPTGWAWVPELTKIPTVNLADDKYVVAVAKIAGLIDVSNEDIADPDIDIANQLSTVLQDSLSRDLDLGLLNGAGPPEPVGVISVAPEAAGADLLTAVAAAKGAIDDAGGLADTLAASGTLLAATNAAVGNDGQLVYPNGFAGAMGLKPVTVPALATPLVYDSTRCYLLVNGALSEVDYSKDFHFDYDATTIRVKARVAASIPDVNKAIRKLTITPPANGTQSTAAKATTSSSKSSSS